MELPTEFGGVNRHELLVNCFSLVEKYSILFMRRAAINIPDNNEKEFGNVYRPFCTSDPTDIEFPNVTNWRSLALTKRNRPTRISGWLEESLFTNAFLPNSLKPVHGINTSCVLTADIHIYWYWSICTKPTTGWYVISIYIRVTSGNRSYRIVYIHRRVVWDK